MAPRVRPDSGQRPDQAPATDYGRGLPVPAGAGGRREQQPKPGLSATEFAVAEAQALDLLDTERFEQAAERLAALMDQAEALFGPRAERVLDLRQNLAVSFFLAQDYDAALPLFDGLASDFDRLGSTRGTRARECRQQAAYCRLELGRTGDALAALQALHAELRALGEDRTEDGFELRRRIGMLLLSTGRAPEGFRMLEALLGDLEDDYGPYDQLTAEVRDLLARLRGPGGRRG